MPSIYETLLSPTRLEYLDDQRLAVALCADDTAYLACDDLQLIAATLIAIRTIHPLCRGVVALMPAVAKLFSEIGLSIVSIEQIAG